MTILLISEASFYVDLGFKVKHRACNSGFHNRDKKNQLAAIFINIK